MTNTFSRPVILVVEEEATLRHSISFTLRRHGYRVKHAEAPSDVLPILDEVDELTMPIALVISDIPLPGSGGLELIERIQKSAPHIPILVLIDRGSRTIRVALERIGITDVLGKPFDLEQMVSKVKILLKENQ
jgi:DNA-binding response OmpR family regulator